MMWFTADMNDGKTVFVFGSNLAGRHGLGAAKEAARFWGAKHGVGNGRQGQSYAIPTKDEKMVTLSLKRIKKFVNEFLEYARRHPELQFLVTDVGCGLAGYTIYDMAPLFRKASKNCVLSSNFKRLLM